MSRPNHDLESWIASQPPHVSGAMRDQILFETGRSLERTRRSRDRILYASTSGLLGAVASAVLVWMMGIPPQVLPEPSHGSNIAAHRNSDHPSMTQQQSQPSAVASKALMDHALTTVSWKSVASDLLEERTVIAVTDRGDEPQSWSSNVSETPWKAFPPRESF